HVRTMSKRLRRGLKAIAEWCQEHRHDAVSEQQKTLKKKRPGPPPHTQPPDELPQFMAVLPECSSYLAQVAESPHTRTRDDVGTVCSHPAAIPVTATSDHPYLGGSDEYALRNPLREICTAGSVRGEIPEQARVDLNGHEAGNGGYSQR